MEDTSNNLPLTTSKMGQTIKGLVFTASDAQAYLSLSTNGNDRLQHLALILKQLGTVHNIRTPHPITGIHQDSRVSMYIFQGSIQCSSFGARTQTLFIDRYQSYGLKLKSLLTCLFFKTCKLFCFQIFLSTVCFHSVWYGKGGILKAHPVNPRTYIYLHYNIDPTEGS